MADADAQRPDGLADDGDALGFDAPDGAAVTMLAQGGPLRAFVDALTTFVDEAVFDFDADGLSVSAVDAANVAMTDMAYPADAMTSYRGSDMTVGMPLDLDGNGNLTDALAYARKGRGSSDGDPVRIDVYDDDSVQVRVAALRPDQQTKRVSVFYAVDPGSIRRQPSMAGLNLPYRADPGVQALIDAINSLDHHDHAWVGADGRTFFIGSQATRNPHLDPDDDDADGIADTIEMPGHAWSVDDADGLIDDVDGSLFSHDYLQQFATALDRAKATRVTAEFGDAIPLVLSWDNTDDGTSGELCVAPRISDDDD